MAEVQRFLCLRCTLKDQWVLFYLGAVLNCDGPIIEAVAVSSSMLYLTLKDPFTVNAFLASVRRLMIARINEHVPALNMEHTDSPTSYQHRTLIWPRHPGILTLQSKRRSLFLFWRTNIFTLQSIRLRVTNNVLVVSQNKEKFQRFKRGEFDNFIETAVNTILALTA